MPISNPRLWTELWYRAAREEMGIVVEVHNAKQTIFSLSETRPEGFGDFTVCATPNPNIIFIVKPGVELTHELPK
jgi:hypothetical protein